MKRLVILFLAFTVTTACKKKQALPPEPEPEPQTSTATQTDGQTTVQIEVERQKQPNDAMGPGTEKQAQLLVRAKAAFLNNRWDEAEAVFKELTITGPVSGPQVTAYIALGQIYNDSERESSAQELYAELLKKAPETPEVHFVMARTLAEQGETTRAMKEYEKTVKLQPDYLQAWVELGGLYSKSGRKEEAERTLYTYEKKVYKLAADLENPDTPYATKLELLEIFSFVNDDRANQAIAKNVLDPHPEVRERAIWLAVDLKLGAVRPNLEVLAQNDPSRRVRFAAKEALRSLKGTSTGGAEPTKVVKKQ